MRPILSQIAVRYWAETGFMRRIPRRTVNLTCSRGI